MTRSKAQNMNQTTHFKLFKAGKLWLVGGLSVLSLTGMFAISQPVIGHADTVQTTVKTNDKQTESTSAANQTTASAASKTDTQSMASNSHTDTNTPASQASTNQVSTTKTDAKSTNMPASDATIATSTAASTTSTAASTTSNSVATTTEKSATVSTSASAASATTTTSKDQVATPSAVAKPETNENHSTANDETVVAKSTETVINSDTTSSAPKQSSEANSATMQSTSTAINKPASDTAATTKAPTSTVPVSTATKTIKPAATTELVSKTTKAAETTTAKKAATKNVVTTTPVKARTLNTTASIQSFLMLAAKSSDGTDIWTVGDQSRPRVDAIDISSYQGALSQRDFNTMQRLGVKTIIIKATQGDSYVNPYFLQQIKFANAAGMNVDLYHYATFSTMSQSNNEANHLAKTLKANSINKNVLIFADMEDSSTYTTAIQSLLTNFWNVLTQNGYSNHAVYTGGSYLYRDAVINTVGTKRTWFAQYLYTPSANNLRNTQYGAWQDSSSTILPSGASYTGYLDASIDYDNLFTQSAGTHTIGSNTSSDNNQQPTNNIVFTNASGKYRFTKTTAIKGSADDNAATIGTYYTGDTVNINGTAVINGHHWLTYLSANGQHYVDISNGNAVIVVAPNFVSASGKYTFTTNTAIKSSADNDATTIGTYYKGDTVLINGKSTVGGETWLRYTSANNVQHYVNITNAPAPKPAPKPVITNMSGTYTFTQNTAIKGSADNNATTIGTYYTGNKVSYNAKVTVGNQTWLRYTSYNNTQHYVNITNAPAPAPKPVVTNMTGTYTFTQNTAIKGNADNNAATIGTYYTGNQVSYNAKVTVGNQTWLRYTSYNNTQHYVNITNAPAPAPKPVVTNMRGTYTFNKTTAIKTSADNNATTVGTYYAGNKVAYNAKVTIGNQTWLRYTSYNNTQHYVNVTGTNINNQTVPSSGNYTFKTTTNIRTSASTNGRIVGTYYKGDTVHYFGTVQNNGYTWLKYYSSTGIHYAAIVD